MWSFPTCDFVSGQLVACDETSCDRFHEGSWKHFVNTRSKRRGHSSAVYGKRILLIGGFDADQAERTEWSTEWIPADGSPSQEGPFRTTHGLGHCTIQVAPDVVVVTGGYVKPQDRTQDYVTEFSLTEEVKERPLARMNKARFQHTCGVYQEADGQQ